MEDKINNSYLRTETLEQLKTYFLSNKGVPSVHLYDFLDKKFYLKLRKEVLGLKFKIDIDRLSHMYQSAEVNGGLKDLFGDKNLLFFVSSVVRKPVRKIDALCYVFGAGDYTVLNDLGKEKPGIDFVLDLTDQWVENAGGQIVYTENKGDGLVVPTVRNSLLLVHRKNKHIRRFVKYVNHHAAKNKRLLVMGKIELSS